MVIVKASDLLCGYINKMNIFIHGIFTSDSSKSIGKLKKFVKSSYSFDYGYIGVIAALFKNKSIAKDLSKIIKASAGPVTIRAHSNGNAIAVIAADKYGAKIENLICIAPALNKNLVFPKSIKNILVLSTKKDKATKAARFFDSIPLVGCLVPDIWGSMGTDNYTGDDKRVSKAFLGDFVDDHSDYFSDDNVEAVAEIIDIWLNSLR